MERSTPTSEHEYISLAEEIHGEAPNSPTVLCGFAACIDRIFDLDTILRALEANGGNAEIGLKKRLIAHAVAGSGGEFQVDWPDGPRFFADIQPIRALPGGGSTQVAQQLAIIGAKPLLALERRDQALLDLLHHNVRLAPQGQTTAAERSRRPVSSHQIIEFSTERGIKAPRADRVILRFSSDHFEFDDGFEELSRSTASSAGAAVLSGFNALASDEFDRALSWSRQLASAWKDAGTPVIHMELADFKSPQDRQQLLEGFAGICNSIGMSAGELEGLAPGGLAGEASIPDAMLRIASDLQLDRVSVHADRWAISFTHADPETELRAIKYGCFTASVRARKGYAVKPAGERLNTVLNTSPWLSIMRAVPDGHFVSCPTPYLTQPTTTIGLGDSFLAGTLAVLARTRNQHC